MNKHQVRVLPFVSVNFWLLSCIDFTCMRPYVTLQKPRPRKTFPTISTFASLHVRPNVHRIRRHGNVYFVTVWTGPCFFVCQRPVCLSVPCQVTARAVSFTALRTGVNFGRAILLVRFDQVGVVREILRVLLLRPFLLLKTTTEYSSGRRDNTMWSGREIALTSQSKSVL